VKLVHLVGFVTKKFVTMHGHTNVKLEVIKFLSMPIQHSGMLNLKFVRDTIS